MRKIDMNNPLVSICCNTYNHEDFIVEAIEGFLMQKTDFPFEILIHDDASTDGTADIIRKYEKKYPDLIKPIYQTENQYSKGIKITTAYQRPRAKGKYIALCEGDDYWIDSEKLQKQVGALEENPDCSMSAHRRKNLKDGKFADFPPHPLNKERLTLLDISESVPFQTATVVYRKSMINHPKEFIKGGRDIFGFMLLAEQGDIIWMDDIMSVYRIHDSGVFQGMSLHDQQKGWKKHIECRIDYFSRRKNKKVVKKLKDYYAYSMLKYAQKYFNANEYELALKSIVGCFKYGLRSKHSEYFYKSITKKMFRISVLLRKE